MQSRAVEMTTTNVDSIAAEPGTAVCAAVGRAFRVAGSAVVSLGAPLRSIFLAIVLLPVVVFTVALAIAFDFCFDIFGL